MNSQVVFVVGCSRSGTTWLQHMLGAHPAIATAQETDLFSAYIDRLERTWDFHTRDSEEEWRQIRFKGLPAVLTQAEFEDVVRSFVERVYAKILSLKPSAKIVLDKDPPYSLHIGLIGKYVPNARFIHVIRDGRDVAASMNAASRAWGRIWAPQKVEQAAHMWRQHVLGARTAAERGYPYIELRYEDLLTADAPAILQGLFEFCGIESTMEECASLCEAFSFSTIKAGQTAPSSILWSGEVARRVGTAPSEPDGFFREGKSGTWKQDWGQYERWAFDRVAGDVLRELGYANDDWPGTMPFSSQAFTFLRTMRRGTGLLMRAATGRLSG